MLYSVRAPVGTVGRQTLRGDIKAVCGLFSDLELWRRGQTDSDTDDRERETSVAALIKPR